jgi:hypothetical protein
MATVANQAMRENDTGVSSRTPVTAALTPELAIAYVRELSADVLAAVVLDGDGTRLAGPEALAAPARALLAAAGDAPDVAVRAPSGVVVAARSRAHALVAAAGPLSLLGPSTIDARRAVDAMSPGTAVTEPAPAAAPPDETLVRAAEAVISATHGAI